MADFTYEFDASGNIIQRYSREQFRANTAEVLKKLADQLGHTSAIKMTPILPKGCIAYWRARFNYYLIERPPAIHPFRWAGWYNEDEDLTIEGGQVNVSMPWQYFLVRYTDSPENQYGINEVYQGVQLLWALDRLETFEDRVLFSATLPNISGIGEVCLGDVYPEGETTRQRIEDLVDNFYESDFNGDLGWNVPYSWSGFDTFEAQFEWERRTQSKGIVLYKDWDAQYRYNKLSLAEIIGEHNMPRANAEGLDFHTMLTNAIAQSQVRPW